MTRFNRPFLGLALLLALNSCSEFSPSKTADSQELTDYYQLNGPDFSQSGIDSTQFILTNFAGPDLVPSPSCLSVAATGEVFVGVDMIGSLGKEPGKGKIVRLIDQDKDGVMDSHTVFAQVDNPRGIIAMGEKVYVLHTVFGTDSIASNMDLVVFEDKNADGIADGPSQPLIKNISNQNSLRSRGTDHSTNGIRMGIDGWIYIAIGDFGFFEAEDRSGKKLTMLGGGIVRVRPDGTEMEVYAHGTRNIYDVAIDPFMNIFTRGNTNDGGGWNVRFIAYNQTGEYGYPSLFKNFTEEILPALVDVGGGSGTGSFFLDDPRWPSAYNHTPLMADWGKSELFVHRVKPDGPGFQQQEEHFLKLSQITDLDLDASGIMYLSAWDGAGYRGNPEKGYVIRMVPVGLNPEAAPDFKNSTSSALVELLKAPNAVIRLAAQQELLQRGAKEISPEILALAQDKSLPLQNRVAAVYTYAQLTCAEGIEALAELSKEDKMREFALRALSDRKSCLQQVPLDAFTAATQDANPRVQAAAIIGLGRIGNPEATKSLLAMKVPGTFQSPAYQTEGPHATPNSEIILPHLAVKALVEIKPVDELIEAIDSDESKLALWALRYIHVTKAVNGLISAYSDASPEVQKEILFTLSRTYQREAPYDASWWWGTRPDTHGPYYKGEEWEGSAKIREFLLAQQTNLELQSYLSELNDRNRLGINELGTTLLAEAEEEEKVDLESIKNKKGQVGNSSIEDVILGVADVKGDAVKGKALFASQGCLACHTIEKGQPMKGPYMGQIGSIMSRDQIVESILKPNASISQGFATVLLDTKDGKTYTGFVTAESAEKLTIRDIGGNATTLEKSAIKSRKQLDTSMMPAGLANSLSFEELASLVSYLQQQK
ncbi:HEAT repeat domain-containing protein [Algoriphagus aquatilis]|uniref:HEAT repeat domain-containing protein n=1 Tax=Algoriphagus aquatilis TaxID=490186 RepID=A0ABW0BSW1_9BACT